MRIGAFTSITKSQVSGKHLRLRCRLGWHRLPDGWSKPRVVPDVVTGPGGPVLMGYHWTSHRACPDCGAIQTKFVPLER